MKVFFTIFITIFCSQSTFAQQLIDQAYIKSKTQYFKVEDQQIRGPGSQMLRSMMVDVQFIGFGERHYSYETSKLIEAMLPLLKENGFDNFALEIGPHSVEKLKELSQLATKTIEQLHAFNSKYAKPAFEAEPIPFFAGVEDAAFLQVAREQGFDLWGLDQEYFHAIFYLTDELLDYKKDDPNFAAIQKRKAAADTSILKWFTLDNESEKGMDDMFDKILAEPAVEAFFADFEKGPVTAQQILKDLKISWDIYVHWREGSHADRVSYMRNNFLKNYAKKKPEAKVFLKFGQLHIAKTISNRAYDLGHLIQELATQNGTNAITINCWTRFYEKEDGELVDYMKEPYNYYSRLNMFFQMARKTEWAIIDLKSIHTDLKNKKIRLPEDGSFHSILALLENYDYQLILPQDKTITYNMKF